MFKTRFIISSIVFSFFSGVKDLSLFLKFNWKISKSIVLVLKLLFWELTFEISKKIIGKKMKSARYLISFFKFTLEIKIKGKQNIWIIK